MKRITAVSHFPEVQDFDLRKAEFVDELGRIPAKGFHARSLCQP